MSSGYIKLKNVGLQEISDEDTPLTSGTENSPNMAEGQPIQLYLVAILAAMGGLLFGYDTGVVSGGMILVKEDFDIDETIEGIDVGATPAAAMVFAGIGGIMGNKLGRRITILVSSVIFTIGTGLLAGAVDQWMFLVGRLVVGAGVGLASMIVPLYLAECAPDSIRGTLVTMNQMMITFGILLANLMDGAFAKTPHGWRYAFGIGAVPAVIMFLGLLMSPESPRYLIMKGKVDEARKCLNRIRSKDHNIEGEIQDILNVVKEEEKISESVTGNIFVEMIKSDHVKRALIVGCMLQFFQQFSGINTVMYYGGTILLMAGISPDKATVIWYSCIIFAVNFVMAFPGMLLIEKLGRRILTIASLVGITISMIVIGVTFQISRGNSDAVSAPELNATQTSNCATMYGVEAFCTECTDDPDCGFCFTSGSSVNGSCVNIDPSDGDFAAYGRCAKESIDSGDPLVFLSEFCMAKTEYGIIIMIGLIVYLISFSAGIACTAWTVNAEIYPLWARSAGVSIATAVNWGVNIIISTSFPKMKNPNEGLGPHGTFYFFAAASLLGLVCVVILMPETKGKSMEEMEIVFSVPLHKKQKK